MVTNQVPWRKVSGASDASVVLRTSREGDQEWKVGGMLSRNSTAGDLELDETVRLCFSRMYQKIESRDRLFWASKSRWVFKPYSTDLKEGTAVSSTEIQKSGDWTRFLRWEIF